MPDVHVPPQLALFRALRGSPLLVGVINLAPGWVKQLARDVLLRGQMDENRLSEHTLETGGRLLVPHDRYWLRYLNQLEEYEPEIRATIDRFVAPGTLFIDAGANIGLWSAYACGLVGEQGRVVAIEPGAIGEVLIKNQERNGGRFDVLRKAIAEVSGQVLDFYEYANHAGSSLKGNLQSMPPVATRQVETVSLDDIVAQAVKENRDITRVVLKLDVEGFEREALAGMRRAMESHDVLIAYEDHGKDKTSETTRHVLEQLGLYVYYPGERGGMRQIEDASELDAIKKRHEKGYNFLACKPGGEMDRELQRQCRETEAKQRSDWGDSLDVTRNFPTIPRFWSRS
ncbi:MAG: FkbM family methyltransferase [Alphaproteobacteria bacterium]|nr:FkbM family methyltransferase [Alphaproteobacteria bacterium]